MKTKLIITGHARHGKDTVCEILRDSYGFKFESSSKIACELFLFDKLKEKYNYKTIEECFEDRVNHRKEWFNEIVKYNKPLYRLGMYILGHNDIYCGLRNIYEINSIKKNLNHNIYTIWVNADKRHPIESYESISITAEDCDFIIDNNGTIEELKDQVEGLICYMKDIFKEYK